MSIRNHAFGHPPMGDTLKTVSTITPVPPGGTLTFPAEVPSERLAAVPAAAENRALGILLNDARAGRPVHVEHIPARAGCEAPWPQGVPAQVIDAFAARGIPAPWTHQAAAAAYG